MNSSIRTRRLTATFFLAALTAVVATTNVATPQTAGTLGSVQLHFTENKGQWDERVLFKADGGRGLTWWFERDGLTLAVSVPDTTDPLPARRGWQYDEGVNHGGLTPESAPRKGHALKLRFVSSISQSSDLVFATDKNVYPPREIEVIPEGKLGWNNNYFLGNDSTKWAPDCGNFTRLTYRNVWDGIDVVYYAQGDNLKYDYVIHPGSDPADVRLRWLGLDNPLALIPAQAGIQSALPQGVPTLRADGELLQGEDTLKQSELLLTTSVGTLREAIPLAYQCDESGSRVPVEVTMRVLSENEFGLEVVGTWDKTKELVVDPLVYSTFLGGRSSDYASRGVVIDEGGGLVIAGTTGFNDFPITEGAFDVSFNGEGGMNDAFIARFSRDGSELLYSTFLGGIRDEYPIGVVQDVDGGVVVAGWTWSRNFPITRDALDSLFNGNYDEGFICRLSRNGNELLYGSYFGGSSDEKINALALDEAGGVVVAGDTESEDLLTTENAFDRELNQLHGVFVARFTRDCRELIYCTYLEGQNMDHAHSLASDGAGGIIVAGNTWSDDFPTTEGAFDESFNEGVSDGFIARLSEDGSELLYGTYFGGSSSDVVYSLTSDGARGVFIAGSTGSDDLPTTESAFDRSHNGDADGFIARLNSDGNELMFSTFLGGSNYEIIISSVSDGSGGVVVSGTTSSDDFPTTEDAFDVSFNGVTHDVYFARLNGDGSRLTYSTYIGGSDYDLGSSIVLDDSSRIVLTGATDSDDFPVTEGAFDGEINGGFDAFIVSMDIGLPFLWWIDMPDMIQTAENDLIEFSISGVSPDENAGVTLTYVSDDLPDSAQFTDHGDGTGTFIWQTTFDDAGEYIATFTLSDGENEISAEVNIIVNNVNRAPVWEMPPPERTGCNEGEGLSIIVVAVDPDNDSLRYEIEAQSVPAGCNSPITAMAAPVSYGDPVTKTVVNWEYTGSGST